MKLQADIRDSAVGGVPQKKKMGSRDTYPESYITEYILIYEGHHQEVTNLSTIACDADVALVVFQEIQNVVQHESACLCVCVCVCVRECECVCV